jgi:hypothetical protein
MTTEYFWQKDKESDICRCWTKKETLKLLAERGGRAWMAFRENGKPRIKDFKVDIFGKEIK